MTLGEYIGAGSGITKGLYHLNGNSNDASGNGNNGTDTAITYGTAYGRFGQGARFNGSNSVINFGNIVTSPFTISLRINLTTKTGVFRGVWETGTNYAMINYSTALGDVVVYSNQGGGYTGFGALDTGKWYNLIITLSGNTETLYKNGVQVSKITNRVVSGYSYFRLGQSNYDDRFLNGLIDEVIIENRAWTPEQVKKHYTYTKGRFGIL